MTVNNNDRFKNYINGQDFTFFDRDKESKWAGPFTFICSSDTQFGMMDSVEGKDVEGWEREMALTREAIKAANRMEPRPRFFVICGDLIDAMPGTRLRPGQMRDFQKIFTELDNKIPLVCVCGNHDIGDQPTVETVQAYRRDIGSEYYSFVCGGVLFIIINSQYYQNRSCVQELAREADQWLDEVLTRAGSFTHAVVFQHIPWFVRFPNEERIYYNIPQPLRGHMLEKFHSAGVRYIFCGHFHRNAGGFYKDLELVVTTAIGQQQGRDTHGLRVVKVKEDKISHTFYPIPDIPAKIQMD